MQRPKRVNEQNREKTLDFSISAAGLSIDISRFMHSEITLTMDEFTTETNVVLTERPLKLSKLDSSFKAMESHQQHSWDLNFDIWGYISHLGQFEVPDLVSLQRVCKPLRSLLSSESELVTPLWVQAAKRSPAFYSIGEITSGAYSQIRSIGQVIIQARSLSRRLIQITAMLLGLYASPQAERPVYDYIRRCETVVCKVPELAKQFIALAHGDTVDANTPERTVVRIVSNMVDVEMNFSVTSTSYGSITWNGQTYPNLDAFVDAFETRTMQVLTQDTVPWPRRLKTRFWTQRNVNSFTLGGITTANSNAVEDQYPMVEEYLGQQDQLLKLIKQTQPLTGYALHRCAVLKQYHVALLILTDSAGSVYGDDYFQSGLMQLLLDNHEPALEWIKSHKALDGINLCYLLCFLAHLNDHDRFERIADLIIHVRTEIDFTRLSIVCFLRLCDRREPKGAEGLTDGMLSVLKKFLDRHRSEFANILSMDYDFAFYLMRHGSPLARQMFVKPFDRQKLFEAQSGFTNLFGTPKMLEMAVNNLSHRALGSATLADFWSWVSFLGLDSSLDQATQSTANRVTHAAFGRGVTPLIAGMIATKESPLLNTLIDLFGRDMDLGYLIGPTSESLLMASCRVYSFSVFRQLLSAGADPNVKDLDGNSAIHHLVRHYWPGLGDHIDLLYEHGAELDPCNNAQQSPISLFMHNHKGLEMLVKLITRRDPSYFRSQSGLSRGYVQKAIQGRDQISLELLLKAGARLSPADEFGEEALTECLKYGFLDAVRAVVDPSDGEAPFISLPRQSTTNLLFRLMHPKPSLGPDWLVKPLLKKADVNAANPADGETLLIRAIRYFSFNMVKIVLDLGATESINHVDKSGGTALYHACASRKLESLDIVKILLEHGADPSQSDPIQRHIPLFGLFSGHHPGAGSGGGFAGGFAGGFGGGFGGSGFTSKEFDVDHYVEKADLLLKAGAVVSAVDHEGRSIIYLLRQCPPEKSLKCLQMFFEAGLDPNKPLGKATLPPLLGLLSTNSGRLSDLLRLFLSRPNFDPNQRDPKGRTYLFNFCAMLMNLRFSEADDWQLLDRFCENINEVFEGSYTCLSLAIRGGSKKCVIYLLNHGADPYVKLSESGHVPFFEIANARPNRREELLAAFLYHGVSINYVSGEAGTLLHQSALRADVRLARLLLQHGADRSVTTPSNKTAFTIASNSKASPPELLEILRPEEVAADTLQNM